MGKKRKVMIIVVLVLLAVVICLDLFYGKRFFQPEKINDSQTAVNPNLKNVVAEEFIKDESVTEAG